MQGWVREEMRGVDLGDERLNKRCAVLLDCLSERPMLSLPAACQGWAETLAAYRFLRNPRVSSSKILEPHGLATARRAEQEPVVLVVQDTTELDFKRPQEKVGGPLRSRSQQGLLAHVCLAMTPQRVPLGVIHAKTWERDPQTFGKRVNRARVPIEEKESFRWLNGYRVTSELALQCPLTQVVCLSDSEGDIYECFLERGLREQLSPDGRSGPDWIVRAGYNRRLKAPANQKLFETLADAPVLKTTPISVRARKSEQGKWGGRRHNRDAREAQVSLRASSVTVKAPDRRHADAARLPHLTLNCVLVQEEAPPEGEAPIQWVLITSLPIETLDQVQRIVDNYSCRWEIEIFFRALKSGCRVEELQLETSSRLTACLSLYLIVAWRVMFITMLSRQAPTARCDTLFTDQEWRSVYSITTRQTPPATAPSLSEFIPLLARLGGYLNRKSDPPPGPKAIWIGLQRMHDLTLAWTTLNPSNPP
jgi:hypothetical protein